jgi:replicative DNA helicase
VARSNRRKNKCDLIIIDYLQLANPGTSQINRNREQEVGEMSRQLKALAKELDVPVILLSQLSREVEKRANRRPVLSDLRESGAIEQDADLVIFPFRPDYYKKNKKVDEKSNEGILILAKNRHGTTGDIIFYYNETMTEFSDLPMDEDHLQFPDQWAIN